VDRSAIDLQGLIDQRATLVGHEAGGYLDSMLPPRARLADLTAPKLLAAIVRSVDIGISFSRRSHGNTVPTRRAAPNAFLSIPCPG